MKINLDPRKSLQVLEKDDWGEPDYESHLARTCHRLRRKPLVEFSIEDFRIMIGQQIGLPFLVPLVLEILEQVPLAEGDYYPGDLFKVVLELPESFWDLHTDMRDTLRRVVLKLKEMLLSADETDTRPLREALENASDILQQER